MNEPVHVQIIGAPIACNEGVKDSWRQVSAWAARQLQARFGDRVQVHYYDLFDADRPSLPANARLPLVLVNGTVVSNGGKISLPAIRRHIQPIMENKRHETESPVPLHRQLGSLANG